MKFNATVLAIEMESLQKREIEMYHLYSGILNEVKDEFFKKQIKFIRDQELAHTSMVTTMLSILHDEISKG